MSVNNGGPAFPRAPIGEDCGKPYGQQNGLSLRDYFAGQALNGMLASSEDFQVETGAVVAYRFADAMLAAREAGK